METPADKTNIYISDWNKRKLVKPEPDAQPVDLASTVSNTNTEMPF
jgi:hypothetical protein